MSLLRRPSQILLEGKKCLLKLTSFKDKDKGNGDNIPEAEPMSPNIELQMDSPVTPIRRTSEAPNPLVLEFAQKIRDLGQDYKPYAEALETAVEKPIDDAFQAMLAIMENYGKFAASLSFESRS
jgi:hypothetical protein